LQKTGWSLSEIWVTHHHADHTAGVVDLKNATSATVIGPAPLSQNIAGLDKTLSDGDTFSFATSLAKLTALPVNTVIYSSHEYTLANLKFALSVDPDNELLRARAPRIESLRAAGQPTVPSTLQEELDTNPFLRANDKKIRELLDMQSADDAQVFAEIRLRKDNF